MKSIITPKVVFLFGTLIIFNFAYVESSNYYKCGGSFSDKASTISYKNGERIARNERCVYAIQVTKTVSYNLNILSYGLGTTSQKHGLNALCISSQGGKDVTLSQFKIEGNGVVKLNAHCPILILTFYSGTNIGNSKGFSLTYSSISGDAPNYSSGSKHYIFINSSISYTLHPPKLEESYSDEELSTFIYSLQNNIYNAQNKTVITFFRDELEDCCDMLWVRSFQRSDGMWVSPSNSSGRFVSPNKLGLQTSAFVQSDDVILLIFRSDGSETRKGFRLVHYYQCCYK